MPDETEWPFGPFRLEAETARLWRGAERLPLRPKSFAVLHYLLRHAGRLVPKDALLQAVWPDVAVSEAMLTICLSELRRVLGETRQAPQFIETVARLGYRFIGTVRQVAPAEAAAVPAALVRQVARRTDGNPLFLVTMVDYLVRQSWVVVGEGQVAVPEGVETLATTVPDSLRQLSEQQLAPCSPAAQRGGEVAGRGGITFTMPSTSRCSMTACRRGGGCICTGRLGCGRKRVMARTRESGRRCWRCTLCGGATPHAPCRICARRRRTRWSGMPIRKRSPISTRPWPCWKPYL